MPILVTDGSDTGYSMEETAQFFYPREAVDALSIGITFVDVRLCLTYVNAFAAGLTGDQPQDVIGCSVREFTTRRFDSTAGRKIVRHILDVLRTGVPYVERRCESSTRPGFFTDQHMRRISGPDCKPLGVLITFTDVSDYVRTEAALRRSEELCRVVVDFTYEWEYLLDPSGRFVYVSSSVECITGYSAAMFLENPALYFDIIHPEDRDRVIQHSPEIHADSVSRSLNFRIIRRDGRERWIGHVCQSVYSAAGSLIGVRGSNRDITEQMELETRLRESEALFRAIFDNAGIGIILANTDGTLISCNPTCESMLGYDAQEIAGMHFSNITPQSDIEISWEMIRSVLSNAYAPYTAEKRYIRKDGVEIWGRVTLSLVRVAGQLPEFIVVMVEDITERKRADEALRHNRELLQAFVEHTPAAVAMFDNDMRYLAYSRRWLTDYGLGDRNILGMSHYEVFPEMSEKWKEDHRRALAGATERNEEEAFPRADGTLDWVKWELVPWRHADGRIGGIIMFTEVITERKNAEVKLQLAVEMEAEARAAAQRQSELLQRALLPKLPPAPEGYRVSARYVPGTPALDIGGDFYDLLVTENGRIAILIGDVSGKGVEAVSLASSARATVRAFAYDMISPSQALVHANAVLYAQEKHHQDYIYQFATVALVVIDPKTGTLQYSSAGHPPPVIRRANGKMDILKSGQSPLGVDSDTVYSECESRLNPGDKIVLYTDGIEEARHGLEFLELSGIERILRTYGDSEPDTVVEKLISEAQSWSGGTLRDDAVAIVIERIRKSD